MIKRLVTDSPETLQTLVNNIKTLFTKQIEEKDIEVLNITDVESKDVVTVKMIPLIKPGEMRFEIGGEGETTVGSKIKDTVMGKGQWKDYSKDTLKTKLTEAIIKKIKK
jgi:hypothetical protein